jgi:para-aminobenzoate synthetase component 1
MKARWAVREVSWPREVTVAVRSFVGDSEFAWLDSAVTADLQTSPARYSLVCRKPLAVLEQSDGDAAALSTSGSHVAADPSGWVLWREALQRVPCWPATAWGISPGWVGYVGFEMSRYLERLPCSHPADLGLPLLRMGLFDRGIILDHHERRAHAVAGLGLRAALGLRELELDESAEDWEQAVATKLPARSPAAARLCLQMERAQYEPMVVRVLEYIAAGDVYQVNLAQRLQFAGVSDPLDAYCDLRRVNPAPYAALLRWPGGAVGSVSPELFLQTRGRDVLTRPIKGTRPRTRDAVLDAAYRRQLLASEKEAAELAMIVDLHRNDLGRVCEFGSVRVAHARRVETHPTVFHTVADVVGRLRHGRDALDLLAACFPAGSISGAPKIRALEIIDELEPVARGAYTGALGVLGLDRQMTFNVAIRTLQFCGETATLYAGGGIVADSDPTEEYEETLAKARGIVQALVRTDTEARVAK